MNTEIHAHYRESRDMLIPLAESYANDTIGTSQSPAVSRSEWAAEWSRTFLTKMDELAREQGLIK